MNGLMTLHASSQFPAQQTMSFSSMILKCRTWLKTFVTSAPYSDFALNTHWLTESIMEPGVESMRLSSVEYNRWELMGSDMTGTAQSGAPTVDRTLLVS
jgi:hypothetical protein